MTDLSNYWLIATDLDGTLLDDHYGYDDAASAIDTITTVHNAVVLLASSKTLAEMLQLAQRCTSNPLLLFENGAGMAWRSDQLCEPGEFTVGNHQVTTRLPSAHGYAGLRAMLDQWRRESGYNFRGFGDCTDSEVAALTGLTQADAALARQRLCTEPLLWQDSSEQLAHFENRLALEGLQLIAGGRFLHVMPPVDKADAIARAAGWLEHSRGEPRGVLACGNAPNDLTMLQHGDIALVFPDSSGGYVLPASDTVHQVRTPGPAAWLNAINQVLNTVSRNPDGNHSHE